MTKTNNEVKRDKLTKKEKWNIILNFEETKANPEIMEFIEREIELLNRKSNRRKPTEQQTQNEEVKNKILEILVKPMTVTEIQKAIEPMFPDVVFSNQRITQLVYQMLKKDLTVDRTEIKRRAYFERKAVEV